MADNPWLAHKCYAIGATKQHMCCSDDGKEEQRHPCPQEYVELLQETCSECTLAAYYTKLTSWTCQHMTAAPTPEAELPNKPFQLNPAKQF